MKSVNDICSGNLKPIFLKVQQLQQLQRQVASFLPPELQPYCHVANFRDGVLVFALASSAWATTFRYSAPNLLSVLRQKAGLPQLVSIDFYVEPDFVKLFSKGNPA